MTPPVDRAAGGGTRPQKAISVSYELLTLQNAVEGAVALVELQRQGGIEEGDDLGSGVSALLALVACRLRDLGRVIRGSMGPDLFWAPHNAALEDVREDEYPDLVLTVSAPPGSR